MTIALNKPWHPENGGEHLAFLETRCVNCRRDANLSRGKPLDECREDELCDINRRSYFGPVEEWRELNDGKHEPMIYCTNFWSI